MDDFFSTEARRVRHICPMLANVGAMLTAGFSTFAPAFAAGAPTIRAAWHVVLDSREGESVNGRPLRDTGRWLRLTGAAAAIVLALATTSAKADPTPPQATQSQTPSVPPCSDAPVLKRGTQPDPPPCTDPAQAESEPADSTPPPSLPPNAPLIERAREATFQFSRKLPNFICQEFMSRFTQQGRGEKVLQDLVSAEIIYEDGQESYRNVKINNRSTDKRLQDIDGSWSTGEFASALLDLFDPASRAQFSSGRSSTISGSRAQVYDFQVRKEDSHWRLSAGSQTVIGAYAGSVWVDPNTARVLRIEMQARNLPSDFPMDSVESAVDYSYVLVGEKSFLLPVHAESLGCQRDSRYCSHNIIDFRNYHEFKGDIKIIP
jgi:hypothetical protein